MLELLSSFSFVSIEGAFCTETNILWLSREGKWLSWSTTPYTPFSYVNQAPLFITCM